ncbi:Non-histone chromosomal protein 6 [Tieghemiomyces parasiticus]|uniref:Non-histone chromosomal protein 6 n=1 Tax=Tieghemiomyces parasiticus TaxID=78921 RepID=A0A9W8DRI6_9FUNG|nr:Non-histone chromosomal protein 6 [Tieghemiomyces parasiticus]KAJ1917884.1 Non-histone chromosomal protein 6 [Tieghemiomyces parasiticus]
MPKVKSAAPASSRNAKGVEKKKKRTKKDPNAPKRALSAYMFYSQSARESVKQNNPEATFGELGKLLGAQWKEMTPAQKAPFDRQAEADKVRYEKEKAAYAAQGSSDEE